MVWLYTSDYPSEKGFSSHIIAKAYATPPQLYWSVAYVATPEWAQLVFPNYEKQKAVNLLWQAIYTACRIDEKGTLQSWEKHLTGLNKCAEILNGYNFKLLRFKNNIGTDLSVELHKNHSWITCSGITNAGQMYITNLPTEEVFTAPLKTGVNGTAVVTQPILYNGEIIRDVEITFSGGKVSAYSAKENERALTSLICENENACYLGEVALVPTSSPISQMDIFWYDTSFDENAACHLALGNGYANTVKNAIDILSTELNQSKIHQDFMIGTKDMRVIGVTKENTEIEIMLNGEWVIVASH